MSKHPIDKVGRALTAWKRRLPVALALAIGVAFTLGVFSVVRWWENRNIEKAFRIAAEDRSWTIKGTFETELAMLELIRTALMTDGKVERQEFQEILAPFRCRTKSILAVEWVPRVSGDRRVEFEATAKGDGFSNFQITEVGKDGQLVRAAARPEYFPVYYSGPGPGDKLVEGYDVGSEQVRREAIELACDTGRTVASARIALVQNKTKVEGFLVVLPAYCHGKPVNSVATRRTNLWGLVLGVFQPDRMFKAAMSTLQPEGIDVYMYDASAPADGCPFTFHRSRMRQGPMQVDDESRVRNPEGMYSRAALDVLGHPWTIVCLPTPDFIAARQTWWPWGVLGTGLVLSTLLAAYVSASIDRRVFVEQSLAEKHRYAGELEQKVRAQTGHIRRAQEEIIHRLLSASQWRDEETGSHVRRVGLWSELLAKAAGWSAAQCDCIRQAAPMHDVGKIGIPDAILRKPGKLMPDEFRVMKTHTSIGADMLGGSNVPLLQMAREIALNHHERWDGKGYPHGVAAQDVPESARIVAIVDVYDALTHDRVYRPAMSEEEALTILREGAGTQFDPLLLAHFFLHHSEIRRIAEQYPDQDHKSLEQPQWVPPAWSDTAPADQTAAIQVAGT
ncbi:MAG: CHASE domain-containing protein [Planctomycetaceae bacterium]|nr:CHASE domain-containing protein [Planctomycetaceae bacterium]